MEAGLHCWTLLFSHIQVRNAFFLTFLSFALGYLNRAVRFVFFTTFIVTAVSDGFFFPVMKRDEFLMAVYIWDGRKKGLVVFTNIILGKCLGDLSSEETL